MFELGFEQEHDKAIQKICMLNAIRANKQATLMSLIRLQSMGGGEYGPVSAAA